MSENSYQWLVDRKDMHENKSSNTVEVNENGIDLKIERIAFDDYASADITYIKTDKPFTLEPTDTSHGESARGISFLAVLSGSADGIFPSGKEVCISKQCGLISDFSDGSSKFTVKPEEPLRCFAATLSELQIKRLFTEDNSEKLTEFLSQKGFIQPYRITPAMQSIINSSINCTLTGTLKRMFLEGTALQIFSLIFSQKFPELFYEESHNEKHLPHNDIVYKIEQLLEENIGSPPLMIELSEKVGLSARNINIAFKEQHGTTVFGYLTKRRMILAKKFLEENPKFPLKVLADNCGYGHLSNFVSAFKREFGIPPSQYTKSFRK